MISLVINLDTRRGFMESETVQKTMLDGTRSLDFFTEGIINKIRFFVFGGYNVETIVFIDIHERLPKKTEQWLLNQQANGTIDHLVFSKHTEKYEGKYFAKWNDLNFLNALAMARGEYVVHFDGDMAAFINDGYVISEWLTWLDEGKFDFVCYPSPFSPGPAVDARFKSYWWASTRFFICRREKIDYSEIVRCLKDSDYLFGKYGVDGEPRNPWLEHILGMMAKPQGRVFYPPIQKNRYMIFSWSRYYSGVLKKLNEWPYEKVAEYVGQIFYPCDVAAAKIEVNK